MKILHDRYGKIALLVFSNICYNFIVTILFILLGRYKGNVNWGNVYNVTMRDFSKRKGMGETYDNND